MVTLVEKLLPGWADPMLIPALCAVSVGVATVVGLLLWRNRYIGISIAAAVAGYLCYLWGRMEAGKQYPHKRKGTRAGPER